MSGVIGTLQQLAIDLARTASHYLGSKNVGTFLESTGLTLDTSLEELEQGMRFMHPLRCDSSALPTLARDRSMKLYATEGDASQRYRLSRWKQLHRQRGSHQGEMRHSAPYYLAYPAIPTMRIVHQNGDGTKATWHTLVGSDGVVPGETLGTFLMQAKSPTNFNWDGVVSKWSRMFLVVYTSGLGLPTAPNWDAGQNWDGGSIWDGLLTSDQIADVASMIIDWKGAHSKLWSVILATDPASFNPTAAPVTDADGWTTLPSSNWGYTVDPSTGVPGRLPTARFVYDLGQG